MLRLLKTCIHTLKNHTYRVENKHLSKIIYQRVCKDESLYISNNICNFNLCKLFDKDLLNKSS